MAVNPHLRRYGDSILSVPNLQGYPINPSGLNPLLPPAQLLALTQLNAPQNTPSLAAQQTAFPTATVGSTVMNTKPLTSTPSITVNASQVAAPPPLTVASNIHSAGSIAVVNPVIVNTGPPGFGGWGD